MSLLKNGKFYLTVNSVICAISRGLCPHFQHPVLCILHVDLSLCVLSVFMSLFGGGGRWEGGLDGVGVVLDITFQVFSFDNRRT